MKREMTVEISSEGFIRTGIKSDICQVSGSVSQAGHSETLANGVLKEAFVFA